MLDRPASPARSRGMDTGAGTVKIAASGSTGAAQPSRSIPCARRTPKWSWNVSSTATWVWGKTKQGLDCVLSDSGNIYYVTLDLCTCQAGLHDKMCKHRRELISRQRKAKENEQPLD